MGGSGGSTHCTLINAFVPFSAKNVTGRDIMKGNEDEFGRLRNASASQLVSFSSNQLRCCSLGCWATQLRWERRGLRGYLHAMENWKKTKSLLEGIDILLISM